MTNLTPEEIFEIRELICEEMDRSNGNIHKDLTSAFNKMCQPNNPTSVMKHKKHTDRMLFALISLAGIMAIILILQFI